MKKIVNTLVLWSLVLCTIQAETSFQPGDIAIIGYNFKDPDQFSFVFLHEAEPGTIIYFTDSGYDEAKNGFREGEGIVTYTVPASGHKIGDVVTYPDNGNFKTQGVSGFFGLSTLGDQIFIYQGTFTNPIFIFGLNVYNGSWQTTNITNNNSSLPPGLIDGYTAIAFTGKMINARFNCMNTLGWSKDQFLKSLAMEHNWDGSQSNRYTLPDKLCTYTALPIHHPAIHQPLPDPTPELIFSSGYSYIEVCTMDGKQLFTTNSLAEALSEINSQNMYIFRAYYPDRLEIQKIIR